MIKISLQYDSADPQASAFFNWLSAFPLNPASLQLRTSIDVVNNPDGTGSNQVVHRISDIVIEARKDDGIQNAFGEGSWSRKTFESDSSFDEKPHQTSFAFSTAQPIAPISPTPMGTEPSASVTLSSGGSAFDSDMDDFLLNDVLFSDSEESPNEEMLDSSGAVVDERISDAEVISEGEVGDVGFLLDAVDVFDRE